MIKLSAQLGSNPLRYHTPKLVKKSSHNLVSAGESGELVVWRVPDLEPLYEIVCSALADTEGLIDFIITPLRSITDELINWKIVTVHNDHKIRIFTLEDGLCKNVSQHTLFPQKLSALVQNEKESRFLLALGDQTVYVVDSWSMKVVDSIRPSMDTFSVLKKGKVNGSLQLQLMDKQSKMYRINCSALFAQAHLDVGNWLNNSQKAAQELLSSIEKIKNQPVITSYRKFNIEDLSAQLTQIKQKIQGVKTTNIWAQIMDTHHLQLQIVKHMTELDEEPMVSNCLFLKGNQLWYFFGTNKGTILAIPAVVDQRAQTIVFNKHSTECPVAYMSVLQNLLIASWEDGTLKIFSIDNLEYSIQQRRSSCAPSTVLCMVDLTSNLSFTKKLSSQIKYRLQIYSSARGKLTNQKLSFQLINNQVIVLDTNTKRLQHYRGIPQGSRIYVVLQIQDYVAVAHSNGLEVYSMDGFERTIPYDKWTWTDYSLVQEFQCKNDYHNIFAKFPQHKSQISELNAMAMFEFSQRFYRRKVDYYNTSNDLLYQTFGPLDSEKVNNQIYPYLHFIQKVYSERTIHSYCSDSAISIVRMKHNNIRRQKLTNTTYIVSCNLNKQLDLFANANKEVPIKDFENNFMLFSLLFWDQSEGLPVCDTYNNCRKKFIFKRRYTEQGIGRSFTTYFSNKSKSTLSSQLLTYTSVSTMAMLQVCSHKDMNMADTIVNAVHYFTEDRNALKINVQVLSRMSVSLNSHVVKACITILMSAALKQVVPLHPIYQYFILNLKQMEETKNRTLTETETVWFVYLGLGFIYSNQLYDKNQVKILIDRLIDAIDVHNFQTRPELVQIVLKVFNEGVSKWKSIISVNVVMKIFADLFRVFFYYDGLSVVQPDDKKFNFCFESVNTMQNKKMKGQIIKTIRHLSRQFNKQFLQVIHNEALNQKPHSAYPSSVIQILRQYIKNQKPQSNLVFYIELLLQCLSPMTPQLRKHVQKNVLSTLQLMCSYQNISFNHHSQKLSLKTESNIYIYCLRTSTRWRTISLREQRQTEHSIIQMSPQGTYIALLGDKLRIWRLNSGFWSGVLGAFSQGWTFEAQGDSLKWDDKEEYITVINSNPSLNKCFKL